MGGRFCSLDQTHLECESTLMEIMIKVQIILFPKSIEDKKKVFTAIWDCIRPKLMGFIRADRHFFSDHSALKSQ